MRALAPRAAGVSGRCSKGRDFGACTLQPSRLSRALAMASLLACPGAAAWAMACPSGAVTQGSGTSAGSLSYALASGNCAELSTSVGGGTYTLGQNASLTAPATIDLETTGSPASFTLAGSGTPSKLLMFDEVPTLDISGTTSGASVGSIVGNGGVNLGSQTLTVTSGSGTLGGSITGSGGLSIAGGNETLSAANFYSGQTVIAAGATLTLTPERPCGCRAMPRSLRQRSMTTAPWIFHQRRQGPPWPAWRGPER